MKTSNLHITLNLFSPAAPGLLRTYDAAVLQADRKHVSNQSVPDKFSELSYLLMCLLYL